jgi:hypothetical protein
MNKVRSKIAFVALTAQDREGLPRVEGKKAIWNQLTGKERGSC